MCSILIWSFDAISGINWLEVIKALAALATATIAFLALRNWQRQDKAKREAEFIDAVIEATHTYIAEMPRPITLLQLAKIGMESHIAASSVGDDAERTIKGAIAYIEKRGEQDAKRMLEVLEAVQPSTIKLRSLAAKGQIFNFNNYNKFMNSIAMLTWHFDRIEAFMTVIQSSSWNWENDNILGHLKEIMAIDPNEMRKSIQEGNIIVIEFAKEVHSNIYRQSLAERIFRKRNTNAPSSH